MILKEPEAKEELLPETGNYWVGFRNEEEKEQFLQLAKLFGVRINPFE